MKQQMGQWLVQTDHETSANLHIVPAGQIGSITIKTTDEGIEVNVWAANGGWVAGASAPYSELKEEQE